MSNLRLINETSASSVSSISVTDVFSSDFDIYKIVIAPMDINNNNDMELRFVNSSGSVISASNYDNAILVQTAYGAFGQTRQTNTTRISGVGRDEQQSGNGTVMYVFNPNSANSYSFVLHQDNGFVTGSNGKQADGRNSILIMTSNLGAADNENNTIGFDDLERFDEDEKAVKNFFAPEFRNRLDATVKFGKLSKSVVKEIVLKFIKELNGQVKDKNITIKLNEETISWLAGKGYSKKMGARPLGRLIDAEIKTPLSKQVLFGELVDGGIVNVTIDNDKPVFAFAPAPKILTKAERKAAKAAAKKPENETADSQDN